MKTLNIELAKQISGGATSSVTINLSSGTDGDESLDMTSAAAPNVLSALANFILAPTDPNGSQLVNDMEDANMNVGHVQSISATLLYA